jgi:catechol 2,3-dioxygenase-like lactoylglutathione lyase family enzyme
MRISEVGHQVTDVGAAVRFYQRVLQLPAGIDASGGQVIIGSSVLKLTPGPPSGGVHHLAFDIPAETFAAAKKWLSARVLRSADGTEEFEGPLHWNSRSLYFSGPDGVILELIARRNLWRDTVPGDFSGARLVNISEVGVAVDDVSEAARQLEQHFDAPSFGPRFEDFDPVGDESGLLILVAAGRPWAPDQRTHSERLPLKIRLDTGDPAPRGVRLSEVCTVLG